MRDKTGSVLLPPTIRTRLPLGKGSGDNTCPTEKGVQLTQTKSRTSPL